MMNRKHSILLILSGVFIITFFAAGCNSQESVELVQSTENFTTDGLTLLERTYADTDSDGNNNESIELYTSAEIAPNGLMAWDTGHQWVLLVRKGEEIFPLFNNWVQYGELQFWVVTFNKDKMESPETTDLVRHIYVMVTNDINVRLFNYYWDQQNHSFKKEVVFDPPSQWGVRYSNKHTIPHPYKIEPEKDAKTSQ